MKLAHFCALAAACALFGCSSRPASTTHRGTLPTFDADPSLSAMIGTETAQIKPEWAERFRKAQATAQNPALTFGLFHLTADLPRFDPARPEPAIGSLNTPALPGDGSAAAPALPDWAAEIRTNVSPDSWKAFGVDAFVDGDQLIVFQTRDVLNQIPDWLTKRGQEILNASPLLKVESTFVELSPEAQLQLAEMLPANAVRCGDNALALAPGPAAQVLQWLTQDFGRGARAARAGMSLGPPGSAPPDMTRLSAPTLTTFDGQKGSIVIASQKTYIADRVAAVVDGQDRVVPVVAIAQDGVTMATRGRRVPETGMIDLEVATTVMRIESIDDIDTAMGKIQVARTAQQTAGTKAMLEPGGALLLTGLTGKSGRPVVVLLRVTPITAATLEQKSAPAGEKK